MVILSKSLKYVVVHLTREEMIMAGVSSEYAVIDVFYDEQPMLSNVIGAFHSLESAEDWAMTHE